MRTTNRHWKSSSMMVLLMTAAMTFINSSLHVCQSTQWVALLLRSRRVTSSTAFHPSISSLSFSWNQKSSISNKRRLFTSSPVTNSETNYSKSRKEVLHEQLEVFGINAQDLSKAALQAETTTKGFDENYGKSAIKAYRTHLSSSSTNKEDVVVAARRCARQVDFLIKRNKSQQLEWVRCTDVATQQTPQRFPLMIVLDNVRSAFNVGSIFRTADACGCQEVLTTGITPHPRGNGCEKLQKSALGAEHVVPSQHFETTQDALTYIRSNYSNYTLVGMETTNQSKCYTEVVYPGKHSGNGTVVVLGNEVTGVDTELFEQLDVIVELPMFGSKNSLNIAACAPVVLYEILRQWGVRAK